VLDDLSLTSTQKKLKTLVLVNGQYEKPVHVAAECKRPNRVHGTGIKHCHTNMARVVSQKQYLDFSPSLLLLPIMDLEKTLTYESGKYEVLVACTNPNVYVECLLTQKYEMCRENDLKIATETLTSFVKAAAYTLTLANERDIKKKLKNQQQNMILTSKTELESTMQVVVPSIKDPWTEGKVKLGKFTIDMQDENAHQECDPFLMFIKAAVVWSSTRGQRLLPGCPLPHDCEECLEAGLFECDCDAYDPELPIPNEIDVLLDHKSDW